MLYDFIFINQIPKKYYNFILQQFLLFSQKKSVMKSAAKLSVMKSSAKSAMKSVMKSAMKSSITV